MANAPIPPLFCNTPPPMDDDLSSVPPNDDDDEFGDFANAYNDKSNNVYPPTVDADDEDEFDDFHSGVPAYLTEIPSDISRTSTTPTENLFPAPKILQDNFDCDANKAHVNANTQLSENSGGNQQDVDLTCEERHHDNSTASISSLSEQQLSCASSFSPETASPPNLNDSFDNESKEFGDFQTDVADEYAKSFADNAAQDLEKTTNRPTSLSNVVVLEDIPDDSSDDERHSPRNRNNIPHCDESSHDFFVLQPIANADEQPSDKETKTASDVEVENSEGGTKIATEPALPPATPSPPQPETQAALQSDNEVDSAVEANAVCEDLHPKANITEDTSLTSEIAAVEEVEDDFANFQDFESAPNTQQEWQANYEDTIQPESQKETLQCDNEPDNNDFDDEDDDDFGDFSEAPIVAPSQAPDTNQPPASINPKILSTQLKPVLELMFPCADDASTESATQSCSSGTVTTSTMAAVESARALDYQWTVSNVRHAFIRSLGIDSRNIFLTEKWNPSMPRFAANLSFDPLQPMKPTTTTAAILQPEQATNSANTSKPEVPVAEFDWKSSGLVNPLDGPQEEMATQSIDASNTEPGASVEYETNAGDPSSSSSSSSATSSYTTAETSTIAASTAGATLSEAIPGSGHIDSTTSGAPTVEDNNTGHDIDIGLYDILSTKSSDTLEMKDLACRIEPIELEIEADAVLTMQNCGNGVFDTLNSKVIETSMPFEINVGGGGSGSGGDIDININENRDFDTMNLESEVVTTSTFAGPLKETHIYTPSKNLSTDVGEKNATATVVRISSTTSATTKVSPIDFDYEKAAAGIIIDETVVRKEYRDIEYNPGFDLETKRTESPGPIAPVPVTQNVHSSHNEEFDDEFTDFQSVAPPVEVVKPMMTMPTMTSTRSTDKLQASVTPVNGMILSPAILLPQAISIESKQPKIVWGDSAGSINPEELARIEELFPQDSDSKKSTPTHSRLQHNTLSISATIANHQHQQQQQQLDDDEWSDFVSVPVPATSSKMPATNQLYQSKSPLKQRFETKAPTATTTTTTSASSNDDEWSDFVSSAPHAAAMPQHNFRANAAALGVPQFNSASWQNANFYNNPLSLYHRNQQNAVPNSTPTKLQNNNYSSHNNNNNHNNNHYHNSKNGSSSSNNNENNFTQYLSSYPAATQQQQRQQQQQQQQKIQIMQDFSTAAVSSTAYRRPESSSSSGQHYSQPNNFMGPTPAHFQVGSAKVAPTVSLIPDLGFVAPALPVHTAIISALPKSGSAMKK